MIELIGYIAALLIGIALGLIGGGGSILTVPALVYLLGVAPVLATGYSLFVVGFTSLAGSWSYYRKNLVSISTVITFGLPSVVMVFVARKYILPAIPDTIFAHSGFSMTKDVFLMVLFAVLMIFAAYSMIGKKKHRDTEPKSKSEINPLIKYPGIITEGAVVGLFTGLVGAGGGFLIIPALVVFAKLDMRTAIGTSLLIIATKSLIGFLGDVSNEEIQWGFLLSFTAISVGGIFIGSRFSNKIHEDRLKRYFGWFVLAMGIFILISELAF